MQNLDYTPLIKTPVEEALYNKQIQQKVKKAKNVRLIANCIFFGLTSFSIIGAISVIVFFAIVGIISKSAILLPLIFSFITCIPITCSFIFLIWRISYVYRHPNIIDDNDKMLAFALANNLKYAKLYRETKPGSLFVDDGSFTSFEGVVKGDDFEIGQYAYKRNNSLKRTFYIEINLNSKVQDLAIDSTKFPAITTSKKSQNFTSLEGDFDSYFYIQTDKDRKSQAVTFLAPDLMIYLIDNLQNCDIEFIEDKIYFYFNETLDVFSRIDTLEFTDEKLYKEIKLSNKKQSKPISYATSNGFEDLQKNIEIVSLFLVKFGKNIQYIRK